MTSPFPGPFLFLHHEFVQNPKTPTCSIRSSEGNSVCLHGLTEEVHWPRVGSEHAGWAALASATPPLRPRPAPFHLGQRQNIAGAGS